MTTAGANEFDTLVAKAAGNFATDAIGGVPKARTDFETNIREAINLKDPNVKLSVENVKEYNKFILNAYNRRTAACIALSGLINSEALTLTQQQKDAQLKAEADRIAAKKLADAEAARIAKEDADKADAARSAKAAETAKEQAALAEAARIAAAAAAKLSTADAVKAARLETERLAAEAESAKGTVKDALDRMTSTTTEADANLLLSQAIAGALKVRRARAASILEADKATKILATSSDLSINGEANEVVMTSSKIERASTEADSLEAQVTAAHASHLATLAGVSQAERLKQQEEERLRKEQAALAAQQARPGIKPTTLPADLTDPLLNFYSLRYTVAGTQKKRPKGISGLTWITNNGWVRPPGYLTADGAQLDKGGRTLVLVHVFPTNSNAVETAAETASREANGVYMFLDIQNPIPNDDEPIWNPIEIVRPNKENLSTIPGAKFNGQPLLWIRIRGDANRTDIANRGHHGAARYVYLALTNQLSDFPPMSAKNWTWPQTKAQAAALDKEISKNTPRIQVDEVPLFKPLSDASIGIPTQMVTQVALDLLPSLWAIKELVDASSEKASKQVFIQSEALFVRPSARVELSDGSGDDDGDASVAGSISAASTSHNDLGEDWA